jgi:hypothetical protein
LGIALDMVTAHLAVEYFTVHHPTIVQTERPWLLALVWGVAASWWFGAIAGTILGLVNHWRREPLPARMILRWGAVACLALWCLMIAIVLGVLGLSSTIPDDLRRPTFESDRRLMAVALTHQYEYVLGLFALLILAVRIWRAPSRDENEKDSFFTK